MSQTRLRSWALVLLLLVAAVRCISLGLYPLGDSTEPRYAEVARLMLATGDWITPQIEPGVPFWAKPPLSFWAQAATMAVFGVNEFGARLSSVLFAAAAGGLLWRLVRGAPAAEPGTEGLALLIFATTPITFALSGAVATDMALLACTTAAMTAFWLAAGTARQEPRTRAWGYLFFAALGGALLAKGPVGVAMTGLALVVNSLIQPDRRAQWQRMRALPWVNGGALMLAIAAPWYIAAEVKSPGFLHYFLLGEHLLRFIETDWKGDLYGSAHAAPRGTIWLFLFGGALPWVLLLAWLTWRAFADRRARATDRRSPIIDAGPDVAALAFDRYLLAWVLAAPLFFSLAGNILESYVLPSMPPLALLLARRILRAGAGVRLAAAVSGVIAVVALSAAVLVWLPSPAIYAKRSTKTLVETASRLTGTSPPPIFAIVFVPPSLKFYTRAHARAGRYEDAVAAIRAGDDLLFLVRETELPRGRAEPNGQQFYALVEEVARGGRCVLLRARRPPTGTAATAASPMSPSSPPSSSN